MTSSINTSDRKRTNAKVRSQSNSRSKCISEGIAKSTKKKSNCSSKVQIKEWEAARRKRFNVVLELLRQELPKCKPCPKIEIIQRALAFVKDHKPASRDENLSQYTPEERRKLLKQNAILTHVLKEAGITLRSSKYGEVTYDLPVMCGESCRIQKKRKVIVHFSSITWKNDNPVMGGRSLAVKTLSDKEVQTDSIKSIANSFFETNLLQGLPVNSSLENLRISHQEEISRENGCLKASTVSGSLPKEFPKEQLIVEGDEKNGAVTVNILSEVPEHEDLLFNNTDAVSVTNSSPIIMQTPNQIPNVLSLVQVTKPHSLGIEAGPSQTVFIQDLKSIYSPPKSTGEISSCKIMRLPTSAPKMILLKCPKANKPPCKNSNCVFVPHLPEPHLTILTPSPSYAPIMSTGVANPKKTIIHANSNIPLLVNASFINPPTPRLKRIAPKPIAKGTEVVMRPTLPPKLEEQTKKTVSDKISTKRRKLDDDLAIPQILSPEKSSESNPVSLEPSLTVNTLKTTITEPTNTLSGLSTSVIVDPGQNSSIMDSDGDLDNMIDLPVDMPCIPETIRANEVTEDKLVEMLRSIDEEDRHCNFPASPEGNVEKICKKSESLTKLDSECSDHSQSDKSTCPISSDTDKNRLLTPDISAGTELSAGVNRYSIMSLCISSKMADDIDPNKDSPIVSSSGSSKCPISTSTSEKVAVSSSTLCKDLTTTTNTSTAPICSTRTETISRTKIVSSQNSVVDSKSLSSVDTVRSTLAKSDLSVSSLISYPILRAENLSLKGLDLPPLLDIPTTSVSRSLVPPSLFLHPPPPPFPTPPIPPIGLPSLTHPTLPSTRPTPSIYSFPLAPSSSTSNSNSSLSSITSSFSLSQPQSVISNVSTATSVVNSSSDNPCKSTFSSASEKTKTTDSQPPLSDSTGPVKTTPKLTYGGPTSTQSMKLSFPSTVPSLPILSTVTTSDSSNITKSIFSLAPISTYAHPFPFCALSLSDAPTTFSFTLTRTSSNTSCSSISQPSPNLNVSCNERSFFTPNKPSSVINDTLKNSLTSKEPCSPPSCQKDEPFTSESTVLKISSSISVSTTAISSLSTTQISLTNPSFCSPLSTKIGNLPATCSVSLPTTHDLQSSSHDGIFTSKSSFLSPAFENSMSLGTATCGTLTDPVDSVSTFYESPSCCKTTSNHSSPEPRMTSSCVQSISTKSVSSREGIKQTNEPHDFKLPLLPLSSHLESLPPKDRPKETTDLKNITRNLFSFSSQSPCIFNLATNHTENGYENTAQPAQSNTLASSDLSSRNSDLTISLPKSSEQLKSCSQLRSHVERGKSDSNTEEVSSVDTHMSYPLTSSESLKYTSKNSVSNTPSTLYYSEIRKLSDANLNKSSLATETFKDIPHITSTSPMCSIARMFSDTDKTLNQPDVGSNYTTCNIAYEHPRPLQELPLDFRSISTASERSKDTNPSLIVSVATSGASKNANSCAVTTEVSHKDKGPYASNDEGAVSLSHLLTSNSMTKLNSAVKGSEDFDSSQSYLESTKNLTSSAVSNKACDIVSTTSCTLSFSNHASLSLYERMNSCKSENTCSQEGEINYANGKSIVGTVSDSNTRKNTLESNNIVISSATISEIPTTTSVNIWNNSTDILANSNTSDRSKRSKVDLLVGTTEINFMNKEKSSSLLIRSVESIPSKTNAETLDCHGNSSKVTELPPDTSTYQETTKSQVKRTLDKDICNIEPNSVEKVSLHLRSDSKMITNTNAVQGDSTTNLRSTDHFCNPSSHQNCHQDRSKVVQDTESLGSVQKLGESVQRQFSKEPEQYSAIDSSHLSQHLLQPNYQSSLQPTHQSLNSQANIKQCHGQTYSLSIQQPSPGNQMQQHTHHQLHLHQQQQQQPSQQQQYPLSVNQQLLKSGGSNLQLNVQNINHKESLTQPGHQHIPHPQQIHLQQQQHSKQPQAQPQTQPHQHLLHHQNQTHSNQQQMKPSQPPQQSQPLPQGNQQQQHQQHLQSVNPFGPSVGEASSDQGNLKGQPHPVQQQQHHSPMGSSTPYIQPFDYNTYYRKPPQSPRSDTRHQCHSYNKHLQYPPDLVTDHGLTSAHPLIPPFLENNDDIAIRGIEESPSDHVRYFSVSHLVSPLNEGRKTSNLLLKDSVPVPNEEKTKDSTKVKNTGRKSDNKARSSGSNSSKNNSQSSESKRSPGRSGSGQPSNNLPMWNNKNSPQKQGHNYSAEALISSQNYGRSAHRQPANQNYHFMAPNQMYQSSYSTQPMKNFVQNSSFGYGGHDRSSVCNPDYNFQFHTQPHSGSLSYGHNMPYMAPSYPYQNFTPTSTSMLPADIMPPPHHPGAYARLHDINPDHSNFPSNATFPLPLDPQEMCGGPGLMSPNVPTMGVRTSEPPFTIYSKSGAPKSSANGLIASGNSHTNNGKRPRYGDSNMVGPSMSTPTNFLDGGALSHISLHSFTPPCEDPSLMHSNFLSGPPRHQSNFLLGTENFMPLNSSQHPGSSNGVGNVSGLGNTSTNTPMVINGASNHAAMGAVPPARSAPPVLPPHASSGHVPFNPLRMVDRQQMNMAPPVAPHLSSSLANFNLTSIIPEIDGKNEASDATINSSSQPVVASLPVSLTGQTRLSTMTSTLLPPNDTLKSITTPASHSEATHRIPPPPVLNNSMNNIFPHSHQVGFGLNSSLALPPSTFAGINFTPSEH